MGSVVNQNFHTSLHSTTHNRLLQATTIQIHLVDFQRQTQHFNVMLSNVSFCTRALSYVNEILPFLFLHCLRWTTETDWKFWCALRATISSLAEWFSNNLISLNSSTSIKTICATLKHWLIPNIDLVVTYVLIQSISCWPAELRAFEYISPNSSHSCFRQPWWMLPA